MGIRSDKEIYAVLEEHLRSDTEPRTCVELMDLPDVRAAALAEYGKDVRIATNKVSDALGLMWRKGLLNRYPASRTGSTFARYAYTWDRKRDSTVVTPIPAPSFSKTSVSVQETEDGVLLDFEKFTIFIRPK